MNVPECLGSKKNQRGNRRKHFAEKIQKFLFIEMGYTNESWCKIVEELKPENSVI